MSCCVVAINGPITQQDRKMIYRAQKLYLKVRIMMQFDKQQTISLKKKTHYC